MKSDYKNHCRLRDRIKKFHEGKKRSIMKRKKKRSKTPNTYNVAMPLQPIEEKPNKQPQK